VVFLFVAACQFGLTRLTRKGGAGLLDAGLVMGAFIGSLLITVAQHVSGGNFHNWPMILSACIGSIAGMLPSLRAGLAHSPAGQTGCNTPEKKL
jgi:membrane protein DedA with SNARE-associated domain